MELILGSFAREIKSPRALDLRYSGAPDVPRTLDAREHRSSTLLRTDTATAAAPRSRTRSSDVRAHRASVEASVIGKQASARSRRPPDPRAALAGSKMSIPSRFQPREKRALAQGFTLSSRRPLGGVWIL